MTRNSIDLKMLMKEFNFTQADLARGTGKTRQQVSTWINRFEPNYKNQRKILIFILKKLIEENRKDDIIKLCLKLMEYIN